MEKEIREDKNEILYDNLSEDDLLKFLAEILVEAYLINKQT